MPERQENACAVKVNQGIEWKAVVVNGHEVFKVANSWSLTRLLFYYHEDQYRRCL